MRLQCGVLIIGAGMAGIRAAIEAHDRGADVLLVAKRTPGMGGASFFPDSLPWGIMTAGDAANAEETFFSETVLASCGCIDEKLAAKLARDSNARFADLERYGVPFRRLADTNRVPCFGSKPRGAQLCDMRALRERMSEQINKRAIRILADVTVLTLIVEDGQCYGAIGADAGGGMLRMDAGAVVLAAGGAESLWRHNVVTPDVLGDGYALALLAGASLVNLEFIQFIPATTNTPAPLNFHTLSLKAVVDVKNANGESVLPKHLPPAVSQERCLRVRSTHGPFSNEDDSRYFDIAVCKESGGGQPGVEIEYGTDYAAEDAYTLWKAFLSQHKIDAKTKRLQIYPHCQGFNGGIRIDETCSAGIEGLYACGECAGGVHGANRMGGNAILATQVFGKIAGEHAAEYARKPRLTVPEADPKQILELSFDNGRRSFYTPDEVRSEIKRVLSENAMIVRTEAGLNRAMDALRRLSDGYNPYKRISEGASPTKSVGAYHALASAQAILLAMARRRESRGPHYREDYPQQNAEYKAMRTVAADDLPLI